MAREANDPDDEILVPKEVAVLTKVHPQTVYLWRKNGEGPPFVKIGRKFLYLRSSVLAWMRRMEQGGDAA